LDVLILRPGAMGDTLMVLPSLAQLSGKAAFTFVGRQPGLGFVQDFVRNALDLETPGWHRLFIEAPDHQGLPVSRADLVVAFFSKAAEHIRKNLKYYFPDVPIHVFPSFLPVGTKLHMARYLAECLQSAGLAVTPDRAVKEAMAGLRFGDSIQSIDRTRIVFHPGSGNILKNHSPDFWLKLLERSGRQEAWTGFKKTLLLGPAEEHLLSFFGESRTTCRMKIRLRPDKETLLVLLREAALYLGHDSGITHLAAMLGTPTIALFKTTDINQWKPLGPRVRVIESQKADLKLIGRILDVSKTLIKE